MVSTAGGRLASALVLVAAGALAPAAAQSDRSVADLVETLNAELDRTPPAVFEALGESRSPEAFAALVEALASGLHGLLPRARALRELPDFTDDPELEKRAFVAMVDVATRAEQRALRMEAIDALGASGARGWQYLAIVVDYSDDPAVRERALTEHVRASGGLGAGDAGEDFEPWYRELYAAKGDRKRASERPEDGELQPITDELRAIAFEALTPVLSDDELLAAVSDKLSAIRAGALAALAERGHPETLALAGDRWRRDSASRPERLVAARTCAIAGGDAVCEELVALGSDRKTSWEGRLALAQTVAEHGSPVLINRLFKPLGHGDLGEQLFSLQALSFTPSDKFDTELRKLIKSDSPVLRAEVVRILTERGGPDAFKQLRAAFKRTENMGERAELFHAMDAVAEGDEDWLGELRDWTEDDNPEVRGAALEALMRRDPAGHADLLEKALVSGDWALVGVALRTLEERREPADVALLIEVLPKIEGRALRDVAGVLWRLTGMNFRERVDIWQRWWADNAATLTVLDERDSALVEADAQYRASSADTAATFFGVQVHTSRVIFVIDTSGSMLERTSWAAEGPTTGAGDRGYADGTRMDIAKAELIRCLKRLEPGSLFNIVSFSDVVRPWSQDLRRGQQAGLAKAERYVEGLDANGGTNLYGALETAFQDVDVDTIFVLSDGEPSVGKETRPERIRRAIQRWNQQRRIRIHCIAIGGDLELLKAIATDSGGEYMQVR